MTSDETCLLSPVPLPGLESVRVEGGAGVLVGHGVAGLAGAEEGLVVVVGQLGQAGHELLHRQVLLWPASSVVTSRGQKDTVRGGQAQKESFMGHYIGDTTA